MKAYRLHEGELRIPDNWKDHTVHSFVAPAVNGGGTASFIITRNADSTAKDPQQYTDQQMVEAAKALKAYRIIDRRAVTAAGRPAVECTYTWTTPEKVPVQQRQVCVRQGNAFLVITMTAKYADFPTHERTWEEAVQSLQLN